MSSASDFRRNLRYSRRSHHSRESLDLVQGRVLDLRRDMGYVYAPEPSLLTWSDQSGGGYHCTAPAAANQPTVVASGVDFDGSASPNGDYLVNAGLGTALGTVSDLYVAVVFRADTPSAIGGGLIQIGELVSVTGVLEIICIAETLYWRTNFAAQAVSMPFTDSASYHIADCVFSSGVGQPALDGVPTAAQLASGGLNLAGLLTVVGARYSPDYCLDGTIAYVLISTDSSSENVALARRVLMRDMP